MTIPIQNVYYLLCYAWDCLDEAGVVDVSQDDLNSMSDLFGRILEAGTAHLLKRGLDRQYVTEGVETFSLRGKLHLSETVKRNLLVKPKAHCLIDLLSYDIPQNQILKTTIGRMVRCANIDRDLRDRLLRVYRRLNEITELAITSDVFSRVVLHRNNAHYRLPLEVCRLIHERRLIEEQSGRSRFRDFLRDERAMAALFEKFVRRFYQREQSTFKVSREQFSWQQAYGAIEDLAFLPTMTTDVCLRSATRTIVIDTKYYQQTFQSHFGKTSVKSENLYQLYSYLRNLDLRDDCSFRPEGILLYPTTSTHADLSFDVHGFKIRVLTLNLNMHWHYIAKRLTAMIESTTSILCPPVSI